MPLPPEPTVRCPICLDRSYFLDRQGDRSVARVCECSKECKHCGNKGFVYAKHKETFSAKVGEREYDVVVPCTCRIREKRMRSYSEVGVPGVLAPASLMSFRAFNEAQDRAKKVATSFAFGYQRSQPPRGFVLCGPVGTGKTHLLAATLAHLSLELGIACRYAEISLLYATIRRGFQEGKSGGEIIGPLSEVEVLAIDELGKGRGSQFEMETLDELIARRYNANRTTLFATNYSLEPERRSARVTHPGYRTTEETKKEAREQEILRERVGERIYSRLCEMCDFVELPAGTPDQRRMRQEMADTSHLTPIRTTRR
jgi:DNA replication protein DnaC